MRRFFFVFSDNSVFDFDVSSKSGFHYEKLGSHFILNQCCSEKDSPTMSGNVYNDGGPDITLKRSDFLLYKYIKI